MNKFFYSILSVVVLLQFSLLGWGAEGHKVVNKKAMESLPAEMRDFKAWTDYIVEHSADPDKRRKYDEAEAPRHFINLDYYNEFIHGKMIRDKNVLIETYSDSLVTEIGILPWHSIFIYNEIVDAFKQKNSSKAMALISDFGHYIADAHNPLHTVLNYDGQRTNQKGIHRRYESQMFVRNINEVAENLKMHNPVLIANTADFIWNYTMASNLSQCIIFTADTEAAKIDNKFGDEYFRLLWLKTKHFTFQQMNNAVFAFSSLVYSAWVEAGKPAFNEFI